MLMMSKTWEAVSIILSQCARKCYFQPFTRFKLILYCGHFPLPMNFFSYSNVADTAFLSALTNYVTFHHCGDHFQTVLWSSRRCSTLCPAPTMYNSPDLKPVRIQQHIAANSNYEWQKIDFAYSFIPSHRYSSSAWALIFISTLVIVTWSASPQVCN